MRPPEPRSEYAATGFSRCAQRCGGGMADSGTGQEAAMPVIGIICVVPYN
jgi:hypothetical protein